MNRSNLPYCLQALAHSEAAQTFLLNPEHVDFADIPLLFKAEGTDAQATVSVFYLTPDGWELPIRPNNRSFIVSSTDSAHEMRLKAGTIWAKLLLRSGCWEQLCRVASDLLIAVQQHVPPSSRPVQVEVMFGYTLGVPDNDRSIFMVEMGCA